MYVAAYKMSSQIIWNGLLRTVYPTSVLFFLWNSKAEVQDSMTTLLVC